MPAVLELKQSLSLKIVGVSGKAYCFLRGESQLITNEKDVEKFLSMPGTFSKITNGKKSEHSVSIKPKSFSKMGADIEDRPSLSPTPDEKANVIHPDSQEINKSEQKTEAENTQETEEEKLKKEKPYQCQICQEDFKTSQALASHMRYTHNKKTKKRNRIKK